MLIYFCWKEPNSFGSLFQRFQTIFHELESIYIHFNYRHAPIALVNLIAIFLQLNLFPVNIIFINTNSRKNNALFILIL